MSIGSEVNLIVAALDLQLVRLLRGAMNGGGGGTGIGGVPGPAPSNFRARLRHEPEPRIEPRKVIEPQPRFEPRPVIHPQPRVEQPLCETPHEAQTPGRIPPSPLLPPWRTPLPPAETAQPLPKVKLLIQRPDVVTKGLLIDFFI